MSDALALLDHTGDTKEAPKLFKFGVRTKKSWPGSSSGDYRLQLRGWIQPIGDGLLIGVQKDETAFSREGYRKLDRHVFISVLGHDDGPRGERVRAERSRKSLIIPRARHGTFGVQTGLSG